LIFHQPRSNSVPIVPSAASESLTGGSRGGVSLEQLEIRRVTSLSEFRGCVSLQKEVWGDEFGEVVPASLMLAAAHIGGLTIGAFVPGEGLVGFVFGLTGLRHGETVHWSHMLGVREAARDHGVGRRLKEAQRSALAELGIERVFWTFDPLQARNGHLNLNRLGVRVVEYVVDMYGTSQSTLHHALATDRLVVESSTRPRESNGRTPHHASAASIPVFTPFPRPEDASSREGIPSTGLIEIPWDLQQVAEESANTARVWRTATRSHFQWALKSGYEVVALHREAETCRAFFVIENPNSSAG
jgi:predicted GNAT superfamily acetyltransferase